MRANALMLQALLALTCSPDFPSSGIITDECVICPDQYSKLLYAFDAAIMCDSLDAEVRVQGTFVLYTLAEQPALSIYAVDGYARIFQNGIVVQLSGSASDALSAEHVHFKSNNKINNLTCGVAAFVYGNTVFKQIDCADITVGRLAVIGVGSVNAGKFSVIADGSAQLRELHADYITISGKLNAQNITGQTLLLNMLALLEFDDLTVGSYTYYAYSSSNGINMHCDSLWLSNVAMASPDTLYVDYLTVTSQFKLTNNCQIVARTVALANNIDCKGTINTTVFRITHAYFDADKCIISVWYLEIFNSNATIMQTLNLDMLQILNSYFYFGKLQVNSASINGSYIIGQELESLLYYAQFGGSFCVTGKVSFVAAYITAPLLAGSLYLRAFKLFTTIYVASIYLASPDGDLQQYSQLLETISNADFDSDEYGAATAAISTYNGTLVISPTTLLDCFGIDVSVLLCNGYIKLSVYQSLTTKYAAVFNTYAYNYLNSLMQRRPVNSPIEFGCLRSKISMQMQILHIVNHDITINRGVTGMASFTISQRVVVNNSVVRGYFSYIAQYADLLDIRHVAGNLIISSDSIAYSRSSLWVLNYANYSSKGDIMLAGDTVVLGVLSQSRDLVLEGYTVLVHNLTAHGPFGYRRYGSCCGGSGAELGGCSVGVPLPPGNPNSGDSCGTSIIGSQPGASVVIIATSAEIHYIKLYGKDAVSNANRQCSGAGSGGYLRIRAFYLTFLADTHIDLTGGGCDDFCLTGGAGSAGLYSINYAHFYLDEKLANQPIESFISNISGSCKFAAKDPNDLCGFLMQLDMKTMYCTLNYGLVIFLTVFLLALAFLGVWLTIYCSKSRYYEVEEETRPFLTDYDLFDYLQLNAQNVQYY